MSTKSVNGLLFERMVRNGLNNIRNHEAEVNDMNVFPVSDGDTGINMRLTLENGIIHSESNEDLNVYLKQLNKGMLLGARGNSGVILSQLFNGIYKSLERDSIANPGELMDALIDGYKTAYKAVVRPVEGTILTVTREGAENIKNQIDRSTTVETLLSMYLAEMRKSLSFTPELLPCLKDAGVVDSGATGYIYIIDGMLKYLYGEVIDADLPIVQSSSPASASAPAFNANPDSAKFFTAESEFTLGYCMEFLLQLMKGSNYSSHFRLANLTEDLKLCGDSLVALQDEDRIKVHIHTLKPARVITLCQEYGEFVTFKLENMQIQHNEHIAKKEKKSVPHKPIAVIAVVNGEGSKELYGSFGCDIILDGGPTMNTSSQEFTEAFKELNADKIVILPNNKNIFQAAKQAVELAKLDNVTIIETESIVEGYYALAMDVADMDDLERRVELMKEGAKSIVTLSITRATKDYPFNNIACKKDDYIALLNGQLVYSSQNFSTAALAGLEKVPGIENKGDCIVFRGSDATDEQQEQFEKVFEEHFQNIEANFIDGGQGIFHFVIGI